MDICQTFLIHIGTAAPCESECPIVIVCHELSEVDTRDLVEVLDVSETMEVVEVVDVSKTKELVEVVDVSEMTKIQ